VSLAWSCSLVPISFVFRVLVQTSLRLYGVPEHEQQKELKAQLDVRKKNQKAHLRTRDELQGSYSKMTPMPQDIVEKEMKRLGDIEARPSGWNKPLHSGDPIPPKPPEPIQSGTESKERMRMAHRGLVTSDTLTEEERQKELRAQIEAKKHAQKPHLRTREELQGSYSQITPMPPDIVEKEKKRLGDIGARPSGWNRDQGSTDYSPNPSFQSHPDPIERERQRFENKGLNTSEKLDTPLTKQSTTYAPNQSTKDPKVEYDPNSCWSCNQPLSGKCTKAVGKTFHVDCFLCTRCGRALGSNEFYVVNNAQVCDICIAK